MFRMWFDAILVEYHVRLQTHPAAAAVDGAAPTGTPRRRAVTSRHRCCTRRRGAAYEDDATQAEVAEHGAFQPALTVSELLAEASDRASCASRWSLPPRPAR